jgi:hypothetical protein
MNDEPYSPISLSDIVPGHRMCCICFEYISIDSLYIDAKGQKWDECTPCGIAQSKVRRAVR